MRNQILNVIQAIKKDRSFDIDYHINFYESIEKILTIIKDGEESEKYYKGEEKIKVAKLLAYNGEQEISKKIFNTKRNPLKIEEIRVGSDIRKFTYRLLIHTLFKEQKRREEYDVMLVMQEGNYPDVIAIRKDIEYQELSWEVLKELSKTKNAEGKRLVYLIGGFVREEYIGCLGEEAEETEDQIEIEKLIKGK